MTASVCVRVTEQQRELVDALAAELGCDAETPCATGSTPSSGSGSEGPRLGPVRASHVLEPFTGKAVPVRRGEVLRPTQLEGGQCVDFNAFNLEDGTQRLDVGQSRIQGLRLRKGHVLFSNPPRWQPMLGILAMSDECHTDTLDGRCRAARFERRFGFTRHTNWSRCRRPPPTPVGRQT